MGGHVVQQDDDWTGIWLDTVDESEFEEAGTDKAFFKSWVDITETMVAEKAVAINELKAHWGLMPEREEAPEPLMPEPAPLAPYPMGEPVAPGGYPSMAPQQPAYGTNYPQAVPVPQSIPMAQPGIPPIYGGAPPPMYGGSGMYSQMPMTSVNVSVGMGGYGGQQVNVGMGGFGGQPGYGGQPGFGGQPGYGGGYPGQF